MFNINKANKELGRIKTYPNIILELKDTKLKAFILARIIF